jgi:hypothetical protein
MGRADHAESLCRRADALLKDISGLIKPQSTADAKAHGLKGALSMLASKLHADVASSDA